MAPNFIGLVFSQEKEIRTQRRTEGRPQGDQGEDGHLHAQERCLRRRQPRRHLDLSLPASRTGDNKHLLLKPPPHAWCFVRLPRQQIRNLTIFTPPFCYSHQQRPNPTRSARAVAIVLCQWSLQLPAAGGQGSSVGKALLPAHSHTHK